ncbi:hypothetical protein [Alkalilimnicola sp. S0819]|nr:hypothetical protein [Alkalilimnicola sp. S0819]
MLRTELLLLVPVLLFFAYWLYRSLARFVGQGGRVQLRGLLWLVVLMGLMALAVLLMKSEA